MMNLRKATVSIVLVTLSLLLSMPANAHANDDPVIYYVAPFPPAGTGTSGGSCSAPGFNTIQAAVTAVPPNSLIVVCPGTYTEQVTVSKSLVLKGSGTSSTIVLAPSILLPDTFGQHNIVTITGSGVAVSISGFTISGPGPGPCDSIDYGVFVDGSANAKIFDNSIVHIRDNPFSGCQNGGGIRVGRTAFATTGTATIASNVISDYQKGGIVIDYTGSSAIVYGNTVTGIGPTPFIAQNGIQVGRGAKATVSHNAVSGNECDNVTCGPDFETQSSSGGILLFNDVPGPLDVTVSNNNVFANDIGFLESLVNGGMEVSGNTISDNRFANVALFSVNNTFIDGNTISVSSSTAAGAPCGATSFCFGNSHTLGIDILDASSHNTISRNTVTVTADKYAILLDRSTNGNTLSCNTLSANHGATTGNAAIQDLGTGNTITSCCSESDGEGNFHGDHGDGNFKHDGDGCMDGDQDRVSSTNRGDGRDFQSTQITSSTFDSASNTVTVTGVGTSNGVPVAFTLVALETGPTTPGWISFAFSDGYANTGTLVSGSILLH